MNRKNFSFAAVVAAAFACAALGGHTVAARQGTDLTGRWTLNRQLSQFPDDVGFGMDLAPMVGAGSERGEGGRRGGGGGGGLPAFAQESEDDARRNEQLVDEVRNPASHLSIAQTDNAVTITDDRGRSRTFHPNGREEALQLDKVPVATTASWEGARLVVRYKVQRNRTLVYTYSRTFNPSQLVVQVQFVERGGKDTVTRVYEPSMPNERETQLPGSPAVPSPGVQQPPPATAPSDGLNAPAQPSPSRATPAPIVARGPDAELKGLSKLGVVVEDLSSQASACGLSRAPIEAAVSKSLADAGLQAVRNSDEDTYVYVHVITTTMGAATCVSRYDVFLYTNTTATLSYQTTPTLVQVPLLHKDGLAGGPAAGHGDAVLRSIKQYADEFAKRIRNANR